MTNQDQFDPVESEPTMELLDGAQAMPPVKRSLLTRIARGALYGVLLLSATALLAISAVPELARYASFIPDPLAKEGRCHLSSGNCTALDPAAVANLQGTPCCPLQAAMKFESGGCSKSCQESAEFASLSGSNAGCCEKDGECPFAAAATAKTDAQPADQPLSEDALAKLPPGEDLAPISDADEAVE